MNCSDSMIEQPGEAALRQKYLQLSHDGLRRIERIVHNLLDFSRPREPRPEPTSLDHCIRHVIELAEYRLTQRGIRVELALQPDGATVLADHFQMEQLFLNLVLNAITAMPEGGTLTLKTRTLANEVVAEVCDTGTGIPEEIRRRIFDPFFTTHELGKGTGLGLAVSRRIVQAHGGRIEVESTVGEGTTMRVVLPRRPENGREEA
jgi:signal transduction histidine kinase